MKNFQTEIADLFSRDIDRLISELNGYSEDPKLAVVDKEISNSAGNLALHLIGNLNHFIGAILGGNGYIRDREAEFGRKGLQKQELITGLQEVKKIIAQQIPNVSEIKLEEPFPVVLSNQAQMSVRQFLIHLYGHLNYHLGQINYHRRLL